MAAHILLFYTLHLKESAHFHKEQKDASDSRFGKQTEKNCSLFLYQSQGHFQ